MASQSSGRNSRRPRGGGGSRRRGGDDRSYRPKSAPKAPVQKSFWDKVVAFFGGGNPPIARVPQPQRSSSTTTSGTTSSNGSRNGEGSRSSSRRPESVEVTSPRLYVGNLSFEATESDLFELFNGVGQVQNAEVVTYKHNQRSKGFAFVQMNTVEEAQRAVTELHDKEFLGRKLLVSGAKSSEHQSSAS